jgi:hypothetical protein
MLFKKFRCAYCGKLTLYMGRKFTDQNGKVVDRLCKSCGIEDDAAWEQYRQERDAEDQPERDEIHEDDIFDTEEVTDYAEAYDADDSGEYDDYGDDNECPDGCGQPAYACTCVELESLRRHNANPATRGSYWVA